MVKKKKSIGGLAARRVGAGAAHRSLRSRDSVVARSVVRSAESRRNGGDRRGGGPRRQSAHRVRLYPALAAGRVQRGVQRRARAAGERRAAARGGGRRVRQVQPRPADAGAAAGARARRARHRPQRAAARQVLLPAREARLPLRPLAARGDRPGAVGAGAERVYGRGREGRARRRAGFVRGRPLQARRERGVRAAPPFRHVVVTSARRLHRRPPLPAEELLERPVAVRVVVRARARRRRAARRAQGAGALLRGRQRAAGEQQGGVRAAVGRALRERGQRSRAGQGARAADSRGRVRLPGGHLRQLQDDERHHLQGAAPPAARHAHQDRLDAHRLLQHRQGAQEPMMPATVVCSPSSGPVPRAEARRTIGRV